MKKKPKKNCDPWRKVRLCGLKGLDPTKVAQSRKSFPYSKRGNFVCCCLMLLLLLQCVFVHWRNSRGSFSNDQNDRLKPKTKTKGKKIKMKTKTDQDEKRKWRTKRLNKILHLIRMHIDLWWARRKRPKIRSRQNDMVAHKHKQKKIEHSENVNSRNNYI